MVLLSVVHHFSPSTTKAASERATGNPEHDLRTALEDLANNFGVQKNLVESRDLEERFTIPYLIQVNRAILLWAKEKRETDLIIVIFQPILFVF